MKTLILGGIRSGKSQLAEKLAAQSLLSVTYIATATPGDEEMRQRIEEHQRRRLAEWTLVEEPVALASSLCAQTASHRCVIVDCLTLWLTNLLECPDAELMQREYLAFLEVLPRCSGDILLVSNETNMGVIPLGRLTRRYCDEAGRLHQDLAQICDRVILTVAGHPLVLKGEPL